ARAVVGLKAGEQPPEAPAQADGLVVVPLLSCKEGPSVEVLWQGKPLRGAGGGLVGPGRGRRGTPKTDGAGPVQATQPGETGAARGGGGLGGAGARHIEEKKGEHDGKKYTSVRSYATLVFAMARGEGKPAEDPEASKLLANARAARANWDNFPGFTADVAV